MSQSLSSDSDDDVYTKSVNIKKILAPVHNREVPPINEPQADESPEIIVLTDDDEDLGLDAPRIGFGVLEKRRAYEQHKRRLARMEREAMREVEAILKEPIVTVTQSTRKRKRCPKPRVRAYDTDSDSKEDIAEKKQAKDVVPLKPSEIKSSKDIYLLITFDRCKENGRSTRFMTIRQDESFGNICGMFAKELNCNLRDVFIRVNDIDACPCDTPESMELDPNLVAVVKVFTLYYATPYVEDVTKDPDFIVVKCVFDRGRARQVYISLKEPFSEAKKRIVKELKETREIEKLVFDGSILKDDETPQSCDMEADDIVDVHFKQ